MKKSNSKKMIIGLVVGVVTLIAVLITASILEENDFQFGSGTPSDDIYQPSDDISSNDGYTDSNGNDADLNDDGTLIYIGNEQMYDILNDQSGTGHFVYIGRPTCPACQRFEPVLRETLQEIGQELRYYEVDLARETDSVSEMTVSDILGVLGINGVPSMVYVVNGEVVDSFTGVETREGILNFFEANGGLD